ncbi:NAD(+) diphosphatase [Thioclava sp.]|uniref:NAD(+) diphosphatase n=1 Tax=Thioclava sp. TaxID=1933450 RepID=UPI003AA9B6E2
MFRARTHISAHQNDRPAFSGENTLDRYAELRRDPLVLGGMRAKSDTRILPIWRGRPLITPEGLGLLAPDHALFDALAGPEIFLGGLTGEPAGAFFARDVSAHDLDGSLPEGAAFFDASEQHHPSLPDSYRFAELRGAMARLDALEGELAATARSMFEWHRTHGFCAVCGAPSQIEDAGWQRRCSSCGASHFPRTDPVVIMMITKGNRLLLGRSPGWPEGMYSTLAGFMEPGETVEKAVRREVFEETGVQVGAVRFVTSQPWPYPSSLMLGCHGAALSEEITVDPTEIEDALWITRERLLEVVAGRDAMISPPRVGAIAGWMMRQWLADRLV